MTLPVQNNDRVGTAIALLIDALKDKTNFTRLVESYVAECQELESVWFDLLELRNIEDGQGAQLDMIGERIGQPRLGYDDTTYKIWLRARVLINKGSGTVEELYALFSVLLTNGLKYTPYYPASFIFDVDGALSIDAVTLATVLRSVTPAGVTGTLRYSLFDAADTFTFSASLGTIDTDANQGFADNSATVGGHLAGIL